jgi:membrane protein YdbS with pleckstrin-like domain
VEQAESPFDRFAHMRTVSADTAGGGSKIHVPYMSLEAASQLYTQLSAAAAHTEFRW